MFKVNEYFEGKVTSMAFEEATGSATIGLMAKGDYEFGTEKKEIMHVVSGEMKIQLKGESNWSTYKTGEHFEVAGDSSFKLQIPVDTAYRCQYVD
ncbi:MAG: pyrimidine/purine nucleoside phosphorylase [Saccharospirillaceae bacterium]|nr:pyrimidine/purine nucleoside phosphorylase [Pseudomonadales bacterium]NRB79490.1 pyrimidine/purine nucleoside phosphorylase [Saccharospirillaceae bacterium]